MIVLCLSARNFASRSFCVSKSILNAAASLKSLSRSCERIGACLAQTGHYEAWISTITGLPAAWASAKALSENGSGVAARAGDTTATAASPSRTRLRIVLSQTGGS
jgi:hypothetical protein